MSEPRVIKKYANRRLYDASQSRHITLEDVRRMIVSGQRVKVIEDKTNEDITRVILMQVIAEQEQFGQSILSTSLLESLVRCYGTSPRTAALQGALSACLEKSIENLVPQTPLSAMAASDSAASGAAPPPAAVPYATTSPDGGAGVANPEAARRSATGRS